MKCVGISRRTFLGRAAAVAGGGFAVPYLLPSGLLGEPGKPGPNEQIGIGFIGVGRQGGFLAGAIKQSPLARIVAVCDV
ncbi:MAG TPA: twin-arginine translocation signal domain-containing protein, partial [Thermoguttaceae bacterium]|nr:twin-arginine translocation signal domain-containing protein [Thermoguttaceae bacterium]